MIVPAGATLGASEQQVEAGTLLLYGRCDDTTVDEGLDLLERHYPRGPIEAKVRLYLEGLLACRS